MEPLVVVALKSGAVDKETGALACPMMPLPTDTLLSVSGVRIKLWVNVNVFPDKLAMVKMPLSALDRALAIIIVFPAAKPYELHGFAVVGRDKVSPPEPWAKVIWP